MMGTSNPQSALLRRLALHGGWMDRDELAAGLDWSAARLDDELADLVVTGSAMFNARAREYRLGGSPLARSAMQRLLAGGATGPQRVLLGRPHKTEPVMQVGLASRAVDYGGAELLVMADLELPYSPTQPGGLDALAKAIASFDRGLQALDKAAEQGA